MYIPRFRTITQVINQIKTEDPATALSFYFILRLVRSNTITAMKYGNAWLINLDEIYGYLCGEGWKKEERPIYPKKIVSSGDIWKAFLLEDDGTIIRRPNLRKFIVSNEIEYFVAPSRAWKFNFKDFMEKINPKGVNKHVAMPRMRFHDEIVDNFSKDHPEYHITRNDVEFAILSPNVFKTKNGGRWIINYDQVEKQVFEDLL